MGHLADVYVVTDAIMIESLSRIGDTDIDEFTDKHYIEANP